MSLEGINLDELTDGAAGIDVGYDITPAQASRIADAIIENEHRYGGADTSPLDDRVIARRNEHLDGYGDPRSASNGEVC